MTDYEKENFQRKVIKRLYLEKDMNRFINIFKYTSMNNLTIEVSDMLLIWENKEEALSHRVILTSQE